MQKEENIQSLKNVTPKEADEIKHLEKMVRQTEKQNIVLKKLLTKLKSEKNASNKLESSN